MTIERPPEKIDYGLDAPPVIRNLALAGAGCLVAGPVLYWLFAASRPGLATAVLIIGVVAGVPFLVTAVAMVRSSQVGKLIQRDRLMDLINLRGDENLLDVGCGRGLLLIAAAKRLPRGQAVGIDLWQAADLSDNRPEATLANAAAEGVADRIELKTGDMQHLPFPDSTFDVVVASLSIHNIPSPDGRASAVREIARVLKPGGRVALQDFTATEEYAQTLRGLGWQNVARSSLSFRTFPSVRIVTGSKP